MKKIFIAFIIILMVFVACYDNTPIIDENGSISEASFFQKGKWLTEAEIIALIQEHATAGTYNGEQPILTDIFYSRRETVKNEFNISVLEEINAEDYKVQVARGGNGSFFWMDDNPNNANMILDVGEVGGFSKIHLNNLFMSLSQQDGIYHFNNLKVFETNDEAISYFESKNWSKRNTLYRTSDGDLKVTY